jgi:transcriptional regulator with XRE-family HTH domain
MAVFENNASIHNRVMVAASSAVRIAREAKGYSLEELAIACGLAVDEIRQIEDGADAGASDLKRIAAALGLPAETLVPS